MWFQSHTTSSEWKSCTTSIVSIPVSYTTTSEWKSWMTFIVLLKVSHTTISGRNSRDSFTVFIPVTHTTTSEWKSQTTFTVLFTVLPITGRQTSISLHLCHLPQGLSFLHRTGQPHPTLYQNGCLERNSIIFWDWRMPVNTHHSQWTESCFMFIPVSVVYSGTRSKCDCHDLNTHQYHTAKQSPCQTQPVDVSGLWIRRGVGWLTGWAAGIKALVKVTCWEKNSMSTLCWCPSSTIGWLSEKNSVRTLGWCPSSTIGCFKTRLLEG